MNFAVVLRQRGARAARMAERRASAAIAAFAAQVIDGVEARPDEAGVRLTGLRLGRRAAHDARLRWLSHFWSSGR